LSFPTPMADELGGNAEPALKEYAWFLWTTLACNVDLDEPDFGYQNKKEIKFVALNAYGDKDDSGRKKRTIETIHETTVTQVFMNSGGTMHGGCTAWLIDVCSSAALIPFAEGGVMAVSMNLSVTYHAPASRGTPLRIISTSVSAGGRVHTVRSEIWDTERNRIIASGVHLKMLNKLLGRPKL